MNLIKAYDSNLENKREFDIQKNYFFTIHNDHL